MEDNIDLSLASTDDLYDEIASRHDLTLMVMWRNKSADRLDVKTLWSGGAIPCMGLAHYALTFLRESQQAVADEEVD